MSRNENNEKHIKNAFEDGKKQVNSKCKINKRARKYITVTFQYDNYFVGLLE